MASRSEAPPRRWQLVLDAAGSAPQVFTVRDAKDADEVMAAVREGVRSLMAKGGCRSLVIGVHVEGADCDHQIGGGS